MTQEKTEKEEKFRVTCMLRAVEKKYLQRLADDNARSMSSQLRAILLQTVEDYEDN